MLAAAVAAMMSTASGALIATATVARADVMPIVKRLFGRSAADAAANSNPEHDIRSNRLYVVVLGVAVIVIAAMLNDVVAALTVAYDILVGGLLVAILGGFVWKRATGAGALWSMGGRHGRDARHHVRRARRRDGERADLLRPRREPRRRTSSPACVTPRTPASVLQIWNDRLAGRAEPDADAAEPDAAVPATSPGEPIAATRLAAE